MKDAFSALARRVREEPVLISQVVAIIVSGFAAWGLPLTDAQELWAGGVAVLIAALVGRAQVTPMVKIGAAQDEDGDLVAGPAAEGVPDDTPVDVVPAGESDRVAQDAFESGRDSAKRDAL